MRYLKLAFQPARMFNPEPGGSSAPGNTYAGNVPHAQVIVPGGRIDPRYLDFGEKTASLSGMLSGLDPMLLGGLAGAGLSLGATALSDDDDEEGKPWFRNLLLGAGAGIAGGYGYKNYLNLPSAGQTAAPPAIPKTTPSPAPNPAPPVIPPTYVADTSPPPPTSYQPPLPPPRYQHPPVPITPSAPPLPSMVAAALPSAMPGQAVALPPMDTGGDYGEPWSPPPAEPSPPLPATVASPPRYPQPPVAPVGQAPAVGGLAAPSLPPALAENPNGFEFLNDDDFGDEWDDTPGGMDLSSNLTPTSKELATYAQQPLADIDKQLQHVAAGGAVEELTPQVAKAVSTSAVIAFPEATKNTTATTPEELGPGEWSDQGKKEMPAQVGIANPNDFGGWIAQSARNGGRPYGVVDKRTGVTFFFGADGKVVRQTPVVSGSYPADDLTDDMLNQTIGQTRRNKDTQVTPAGRFDVQTGKSKNYGESIKFLSKNKGSALAFHEVYVGRPAEKRMARLQSDTMSRRASLGCLNLLPKDAKWANNHFRGGGVVYILPESEEGMDNYDGFNEYRQALQSLTKNSSTLGRYFRK